MYSHDGLRDSLTQLAAPTLFYEELRRELARGQRENYLISLVRFVFASPDRSSRNIDGHRLCDFEDEVLRFAHVLTRLSRSEDVCARMGEIEFVCIIRGIDEAPRSFISRILFTWHEEKLFRGARQPNHRARLEVSSLSSTAGEGSLEFLARLDLVPTSRL